MEKKQRKAGGGKRPLEDPVQAPMQANGGASKRARTEMGRGAASASGSGSRQPPERKSLGLLARVKAARGLKGAGAREGTDKKKSKKAAVAERPKDPYILAEEEEIKYLERKLGLKGALCLFCCMK